MVKKGKGPVLVHGDEPQRELGHLHRHGVDVHTVKTAVGYHTAGDGDALGGIRRDQALTRRTRGELAVRADEDLAWVLSLRDLPGFDQAFSQIAAGLHQEGAGAHGHVADFERQDLLGRLEPPQLPRPARGGTFVDQRLQGVLDDGLGQRGRGVVGAGAAAVGARGDVDAAGKHDEGALEGVVADQADKGLQTGHQGLVLIAGDAQPMGIE